MHEIRDLLPHSFPKALLEIPQPPTQLYYRGALPIHDLKLLSVVGSRNYTSYGREVVEYLLSGLTGYPIGIVSGLALGIDSLAHEAALKAGLYTLAIPGGGIDDSVIYPASHKPLAHRILNQGGGLLSEFAPTFRATSWSFPQRNRLVAGISHATLIIEAGEKSGTLITARLTVDYNRELLVVPGSIFSKNHRGVHQFLKLGATPITCASDILAALQIPEQILSTTSESSTTSFSPIEAQILTLLHEPQHRDTLIRSLPIPAAEAVSTLMQMELMGHILQTNNVYRTNL